MEIGEWAIFDEAQSGKVIGFGFAGETGDDVGADGGVGKALADEFNAAGIVLGAVPTMHGGEDTVRGGLQRQVEMGSDAIGGREQVDEVAGNVERFDGADAEALHGSFIEDAAEKIEEFDAGRKIATVAAEIDAAENDLTKAGIGEALNFTNNRGCRKTAGFAANKRDHAERAARIAAVLNFEGWAGVIPFPTKNRSDKHIGKFGNVASKDGSAVVRNSLACGVAGGSRRRRQDW